MALQNYSAVWGQSIYDICLQVYGTLDFLYKLIQDSGVDSVDDTPVNGQVYVYDDALVTDQALINKNLLSGIIYATEIGSNGSAFYAIRQKFPKVITPPAPIGILPPVFPVTKKPLDMAVFGASYTSSADGTTVFSPLDVNGNSMSGGLYTMAQIEVEMKPLENSQWQFNPSTGQVTLLGGITLDKGQTAFYLYNIPTY